MEEIPACFGDLPQPLASRIVSEALRLGGDSLRAWLQLSLVCKAWQELMLAESVALALPSDDVPPARWQMLRRWVRTAGGRRVPIRNLRLGAYSPSPLAQGTAELAGGLRRRSAERPCTLLQGIPNPLASSRETLRDASGVWAGGGITTANLLEALASKQDEGIFVGWSNDGTTAQNMAISPAWTDLSGFERLHSLSLVDYQHSGRIVNSPMVCLPHCLRRLEVNDLRNFQCRGLQGCTQLEELRLWFGFASKDGLYYDLDGLPDSVRNVSIRAPSARVKVRAAPTEGCSVAAPSATLDFECLTLQFLGPPARFPATCAVTMRAGVLENDGLGAPLIPAVPWHLEQSVERLVAWVAGCGAASVSVGPRGGDGFKVEGHGVVTMLCPTSRRVTELFRSACPRHDLHCSFCSDGAIGESITLHRPS